jgi:hypothetical protein
MAQKVQIVLIDDLDGGAAQETVLFGLDGQSYEIDLSTANASRLREALAQYVGAGRRQGSRSRGAATARGSRGRASRNSEAAAMRAWARSNGYTVNERGLVSLEIRKAYEAAH